MPKNKNYWELEGEELENHLASDCELTIIEPMQTEEYFTQEERNLLKQFPKDQPEPPEYDEVLTLDLIGARGHEVPEAVATNILHDMRGGSVEHVGTVFKTARFWCLRVKYA